MDTLSKKITKLLLERFNE